MLFRELQHELSFQRVARVLSSKSYVTDNGVAIKLKMASHKNDSIIKSSQISFIMSLGFNQKVDFLLPFSQLLTLTFHA